MLLSQRIYSKGELDNSSRPKRTRAKVNPLENTSPLIRKSYSLCRRVMVKLKLTMTMMKSENQSSQSQVLLTANWGIEDLAVNTLTLICLARSKQTSLVLNLYYFKKY